MPEVFRLSRLCEEFHALPSAVVAEMDRVPVGLLDEIVETRAYVNARAFYKANPGTTDRSAFVQMAKVITFELVQQDIEAAKS